MKIRIIWTTILMVWLISERGLSQDKKPAESALPQLKDTAKADTAKKVTLADLVKASLKTEGLFTLYQDTATGSVRMYIAKNQLDKEYIYQSFSMGGPPQLFLNQNMLRENWMFKIKKTYNRLQWLKSNTSYYYDPASAVSRAANVDVSEAIFFSEKIAAEDSAGYLISADPLFISEKLDPVKPFIPPSVPAANYLNLGALNKDNSYYVKLRSFPANTDIVVNLAYENPSPQHFGGTDITDARYVSVKMQHSLIEAPRNDYKPRMDHPHVGFFSQQMENMTTTEIPRYRDYINRWHLKKKDPGAVLSEPVEPIVFWVENTTPAEWRQTILDAGTKWNEAFEHAGFKNAVVMKMMPEDAAWDPADIRYNVIRWVSSDLGFAIGPSFINPRTGQILGADITIDHSFLSFVGEEAELFAQTYHGLHDPRTCQAGYGMRLQQSFAGAVLESRDATEQEKKELLRQFLTELTLHEMGHTLGLNHNMKSSHMLSPKELKDKTITRKLGVTGSVMDYAVVNVSLNKDEQGDYYTTKTGPYDHWAIQYGYTPFTPGEEAGQLDRIIRRSTEPQLIFGNDADITRPGNGIDPRVMVWDMSNDMVTYAAERLELVNQNMNKLKSKFIKPDQTYENLNNKFYATFYQRMNMAAALANYVGGIYVDRSLPVQQSPNKPYTPVSRDYQKKAIRLVNQNLFAPNAFDADKQVYSYLQRQRRGFNFFGRTEDPKLDAMVSSIQNSVLITIFNPTTLARINNTTLYGNEYSLSEVLSDLEQGIFAQDLSGSVNLFRKNLQSNYVDRLIRIFSDKSPAYGHVVKSAVLASLVSISSKTKKSKSGDADTRAHRKYLTHLIDQALDPD